MVRDTEARRVTRRPGASPVRGTPGGFVISAPSYTANSAGIGCLYRLCALLRGRGFPAFVTGGDTTAPHLDAPLIDLESAQELCRRGFTAIYPETIPGNPLHAAAVIRWVLNRPGLLGGDPVYAADEQVYYYSDVYRPYVRNAVAGKLCMPTIDQQIFFATDWNPAARGVECFYVGKSAWRAGVCDRRRVVEITRDSPLKRELGKLLRASRVLYCFDNSTILTYEALLCGCAVVVVPDGSQTRQDFERQELGMDGISWGIEEYRGLPVDVPAVRRRYEDLQRQFDQQLTALVERSGHTPVRRPEDDALMHVDGLLGQRALTTRKLLHALVAKVYAEGKQAERRFRRWRKSLTASGRATGREPWLARCAADLAGESGAVHQTGPRNLECYYLGEAAWRDGVCRREATFEIGLGSGTSFHDIVNLLRSSRLLYCFHQDSAMVRIALQCGCPVVTISADGQTRRIEVDEILRRAA